MDPKSRRGVRAQDAPDQFSPRRSGRARSSTIIYRNGYAIKKDNNYEVNSREYVFGTNTSDPLPDHKRAKTVRSKSSQAISTSESSRLKQNNAIKNRVRDKKDKRLMFLQKHLSTLSPFLEKKALSILTLQPIDIDMDANLFTVPKTSETIKEPSSIKAKMRDYQIQALNWMVGMHKLNLSMILGDEMGLGKTLQTIALLSHLKDEEGISGPSLVICPLSVLYSWCNELDKWAPDLKYLRFHASDRVERDLQKDLFVKNATEYDVVITTYEMAKSDGIKSFFARQYFNYLVLDEGHKIKNYENQISAAVRLIHCENSLILTGTPLQNNLVELWSLLKFMYPDIFGSNEHFAEAFVLEGVVNIDNNKLNQAQKLLSLFMLRRLKKEVEKLIPEKIETKVICPLSKQQIFWYKSLLLKDIGKLAKMSQEGGVCETKTNGTFLSNLIMQLRKVCIHPFLFNGAEGDIETTSCEELIAASGKLAMLDKLLRSLYEKKHRVVLFSQFTKMLDIIFDYCTMRGWNFTGFDGRTGRAMRNFVVDEFNAPNSDKFLMLMSTRSGGMGINLQSADTCILFDSDWNPQPDIQAMARVHRIGQTKKVHVYRLVSGGTVEQRIVERAEKKLYLDKRVSRTCAEEIIQEESVSSSEFLSALVFGCDAVFGENMNEKNLLPSDEDIDVITNRDRSSDMSEGKLIGGKTSSAADFDHDRQFTTNISDLAGIDFKKINDAVKKKNRRESKIPGSINDLSETWGKINGNEKRERKNRLMKVNVLGSGYGSKFVPILCDNNYGLEGERSIFGQELSSSAKSHYVEPPKKKKKEKDFKNQDFCQICGVDGGKLSHCNRCPISLHLKCAKINGFTYGCCHHNCFGCAKTLSYGGGLLFPCQSCPKSFCEDCLPREAAGFRIIGECKRFLELGFVTKSSMKYIHCSTECERYAKKHLGWKEPSRNRRPPCPEALDLSDAFGSQVDAST